MNSDTRSRNIVGACSCVNVNSSSWLSVVHEIFQDWNECNWSVTMLSPSVKQKFLIPSKINQL
jgi:hypothetical protein